LVSSMVGDGGENDEGKEKSYCQINGIKDWAWRWGKGNNPKREAQTKHKG